MSLYEKVSTGLRLVDEEKKVLSFWKENKIFEKSVVGREGGEEFTFYDGPPTANGKPHIGHVLTRVIKDMIPRYKTMKGAHIIRKAGWDTHGLPVELEVEKLLGLDGKEQIEEYGLRPFIAKCKESVWKYKGMWEDFSGTVGFWADMDDPYVTYHDDYIESEWWALSEIYKKGLLYKGFKIVPYCPRCGTPLSSHEVAQGYKSVKERSAFVRFRAADEDAYFLVWTTTPWTLPSNTALCVNPRETYCKVKANDGYTYYMAEALLDRVLGKLAKDGEPAYTVIERMEGASLVGKDYIPMFACAGEAAKKQKKRAHFVTADSYVTMEDGTGIVHIAPAFGEDDSRVGRDNDLPFLQFVDNTGAMTPETPYGGVNVKKADPMILLDLEKDGVLFDAPYFTHDYPHCWRCDTPLIYYARDTWFIKMTAVRDDLIKNNNTINWIPETIGRGRFGSWLENVQDWGISRNRYWGTPLNIWECECGHRHAVSSVAELRQMSKNCPETIELHRPFIDEVTLVCPACGGEMRRVPEVIDCWFDSGAMPFAQWHYPFENKDVFEKHFPADFISEAVDQTRGWFYSLLAISTLIFNKAPYKNVIVLGHVQDENGQKMSKSKGNAVDPFEALEAYGADAIRWYFYTNSAPWLPNRFYKEAVVEGQRRFLGTLRNTYAFYVLYANIDGFDPTKHTLDPRSLSVMDRWLLSRLNTTASRVDECLAAYKIPEAARALDSFTDEMSNWYVRRSRERFWAKGMEQDKINAYMTLYTACVTMAKLAAPMIPFMAEEIYRNLVCSVDKSAPISVHLCDFPKADASWIDTTLESEMDEVIRVVTLGRAARNAASIKNRQPLSRMFVRAEDTLPTFLCDIIAEELNIKAVVLTDSVRDFTDYSFKPQLRTVGPKYGKHLAKIKSALEALDGNATMDLLKENKPVVFDFDGDEVTLTKDDLLITMTQRAGFESISENGVTVVLDTTLTEELLEEGLYRELVSKVQNLRKDSGFDVTDHIALAIADNERVIAVAQKYAEGLSAETLADTLVYGESGEMKELNLNGEKVKLSVRRL